MKKTFFTHFFLWCIVIGFAFTTVTQGQDHSVGKAPGQQDQPIKNIGVHPEGTDLGYGSDGIGLSWNSVGVPGGSITALGTSTGLHQGGDFDGTGTFFATLAPATLITVDPATGVETTVAPITGITATQIITGMAWCDATGTMFLGTTDVVATSELYSLNLATGAATFIGVIGQSGLIAIACDCDGNMYSVDLLSDDLWSIDTGTGAGTAIGPTGFDLNFAQDADFNPTDGVMYLSAYNNTSGSGQLRSVDLGTGATTLLLDWGFFEITDFGIMGTCGPPCTVGPPSNPDPPDGSTGYQPVSTDLSWTNGTGATSIEVFFDGASVYSGAPVTTVNVNVPAYSTTYSWKVNGSDGTCTTFGPNWTFTTKEDPNILCKFMDDFEAGIGNWTVTNDGGTCDWVQYCPPFPNTYTISGSTGCLFGADSDDCGSGTTVLSTATLDFVTDATQGPGYNTVYIEFDNDWRIIDAKDEAHVEYSLDGGATWSTVVSFIGLDQRDSFESHIVPGAGLQSDIRFRLRVIQPGWDWWWVVDNFGVYLTDPIIPVELTSFAATVNEYDVNLSWATATETNNMGFEVQRSSNGSDYSRIAFVEGHGTITEVQNYTYFDKNLEVGSYTYRLKQIDFDGTSEFSDVVEVEVLAPDVYALEQNYPNPFNPSTKIKFSLAADSRISLKVFDVLGQEVVTLINGNLSAGSHEIDFNAANLNSGVYFYRIDATGVDAANFTSVKKMILTK